MIPLQTFAEQGKGQFHELKFVPETLKKNNTVELIDPDQLQKDYIFVYEIKKCFPLKLTEKEGYEFYYPDTNGGVNYIASISPIYRKKMNIALNVNGLHISGQSLHFTMRNDCKELVPTHFTSMKSQNYLGFPLKQGSVVRSNVTQNNTERVLWGRIIEDGYVNPIKFSGYKDFHDRFKDYQNAVKVFDYNIGCLEVKDSQKSKDGFYIYNGEKIEFNMGRPNFWLANSKYVGHRVCSDQPNAIFDCEGTIIGGYDYEREVFGIGGADLTHGVSLGEKAALQAEYERDWNKAKILGKKCDEAIAKYEKKTGKKVKISPYYPEELLKK